MLPPNYQDLSAQEKIQILWANNLAERYETLPTEAPKDMSKVMDLPFLAQTLTHDSDEYPTGRPRLISPYGTIAQVQFKPSPTNPYTGLYQTGVHGLIRLSNQQLGNIGFNPSMALKIPIDGKPSLNWQAMFNQSIGQGDDHNFFKNPFTNILPYAPSTMKPLPHVQAFMDSLTILPGGEADRPESIVNLPVYEHGAVHQNGSAVTGHVVSPYEIIFRPNKALGWAPEDRTDYRVHLSKLPPGSLLYTVVARRTVDAEEETIGEIITESEFVASHYGDYTLFFKHSRQRWQA
ncbi:hypothetical protein BV898_06963 [Hypsibius exemplaris]|uniref:Uncharacterized protein n=1 Tax=Hypsibius exemplaris TaxID=2072580 RepID=A0A1W0WUM3_HYPEX|nr:hypothetical protein BV898_06963 [Hypsibius exemplaris]